MISDIFSDEFRSVVEELRVPGMGTENVGPFLASLIQLTRPERVLEVGMGYTTPFLAESLARAEALADEERRSLARKTERHLGSGRSLDESWLLEHPALASPESYLTPYRPRLVAIDDLSIPESSAGQVQNVLRKLGLEDRVTIVNSNVRDSADRMPEDFATIDFAWVDAWECLFFFDHFWDRINPDGGLVAMHYLMTYPEGEALLEYLHAFQQAHPGEMEILNLLESRKLMQNSVTILRRSSSPEHRHYADSGSDVRYTPEMLTHAKELISRVPESTDEHSAE
ncbi:O-methyltransferase [Streptomyces europaeiscabiei]|uniref:class I SAM-dependent methyltransferase n=1 Tax=Streptomyces europaeiscabiei TaxID=146819 RepID=UPI0029A34A90|nr:class I SAM-dependent methyltransferase [Streptomyces europaeiscabiei]MDX3584206.1 class I SAM-dependent methyltransferase [Streptomyces europaeiscabiei]